MSAARAIVLSAAIIAAVPVLAWAVPEEAPVSAITPLTDGMNGKISLDLRKIDIHDALKYFSLKSGLNIVTTKAVEGRITLIVKAVPVQDVFDIMLRSNGLAYDKVGDVYNVMTQAEYSSLYGTRFADTRQVKVFRLQYAIPEQAFNLLNTLKSDIGRILVDPGSGTVLCMDNEENLRQMTAVLEEFEKENLTRVFPLNYAKALEVTEQLKTQLDEKKVGSIQADERANQVIVQAYPDRMKEVERLLTSLDKKTPEVLIDAKIVKVKLNGDQESSVSWEGLAEIKGTERSLQYIGTYPFSSVASSTEDWRSRQQVYEEVQDVGSYPFSGTTSNYSASQPAVGFENLHVGIIGPHDLDVVFSYLTDENNAKILSNPKIAVVNNQESRIHVGEKQAYVTTTTTTGQSTSTVSEQVTFIDVGIQMSVTPTISDDGFVNLKLKTEVSSVVDTLVTPSGNRIPIVDTSLAETTVLVKESSTIIIGGLRKDETGSVVRGVPILRKIPLLGKLFESRIDRNDHTELLIMLTPKIISGEALEDVQTRDIGIPDIKPAQEYGPIERRTEELQTYEPAPTDEPGMPGIKGVKTYRQVVDEVKK